LVVLCAGAVLGASATPSKRPIALVLDESSASARSRAAAEITRLGGRVVHAFDDVLVVELPADGQLKATRLPGVREVALNALANSPRRRGQDPSFGQAAWNAIARESAAPDRGDEVPGPIEDDALTAPPVSLDAVRAARRGVASSAAGPRTGLAAGASATFSAPLGAPIEHE
jgi:hypothetical protein